MRVIPLVPFAVAVLAFVGCSDNAAADDADLNGRTFVSVQVDGDQIPGGGPLTVGFDNNQISTFAGCNRGSGTADLSDGRITTQLAMTMMARLPPSAMPTPGYRHSSMPSRPGPWKATT